MSRLHARSAAPRPAASRGGSGVTALVLGYAPLAVAGLAAGWLLAGLPLLLAGVYRPVPATLLGVPVAIAFSWVVLHRCPRLDGPAWAGWLAVAAVVAFVVLAWGWSSEHVVLRRDAGSYGLYAQWLAGSGRLPIPASSHVFDSGAGPVSFASPGFYGAGGSVVPQFMPGAPMLLAAAGWLGGLTGILHADAVLGGAALLAVAGLAARVAGPRWAPFAALGTGAAYPVLHAARSPYSEPLALLLLFGGLALLAERRPGLVGGLLGGLLAGLATVARVDAPADLLLLVPYAVLAAPLAGAGLTLGVGCGLGAGVVLSRPYVGSLRGELVAIAAAAVLLIGLSFAGRWRWRAGGAPRWAPDLAGAAVAAAAVLFAVRPAWQTVRRPNAAQGMIGALQQRQGLPLDPTRTYDEQALHWVGWWLGWPMLLLAVAGLALLVRRRLRAPAARQAGDYDPAPFLLVLCGAALTVLWKPSITPDHPWADRRLVPVVLPGLVICAAWLLSRIPDWLPRRRAVPAAVVTGVVAGIVALVPIVVASAPLLAVATERDEVAAVHRLCARLGPQSAVVITGSRGRNELPQTVRGICGLPVAVVADQRLAAVLPGLRTAVGRSGRQLAVLAMSPEVLRAAGLAPVEVEALHTREDARRLATRPGGDVPLTVEFWLAR